MHTDEPHPAYAAIDWSTWVPRDKATLCFILHEGQVLLIEKKRGLGAGKVNGPGGRFEPGETPEQCAIRETQEELGVMPLALESGGCLRFQFADGYSLEAHLFRARGCEGTAIETDEAVPLWTPLTAIPYERMWADDVLWLPQMLAGERVEGEFLFDDDRMLGWNLRTSGVRGNTGH